MTNTKELYLDQEGSKFLANLTTIVEMKTLWVVIDAKKNFKERLCNLIAQHLTLNESKYFNILKELKGIPSSGLVTVVSTVWGCHIWDRHIIQEMASCFYSIFKVMA